MNWILSLICLLILFSMYKIIGREIVSLFCLESNNDNVNKDIFAGFIIVFFIGFIIGFPCQYFHVNWKLFKITYALALLFLAAFCIYKQQEFINKSLTNIKKFLMEHIKNNWFIYLVIAIFMIFAITNVLVYYQHNYDDVYYLGKIVNQIGSNNLSLENYFNGAVSSSESIIRLVNTYEIVYGFFSDVFNISVPFFCRVTMALHNYFLMFNLLKTLANYFVKTKNSQFVIAPYVILVISAGFLMEGDFPISINMFDGWQLQTAMYYGGSTVRTMAIPMILLFSERLLNKIEIKNVVFMVIMYITFMSFSTIFLIHAIILTIVLFLCKGLFMLCKYNNDRNRHDLVIGILLSGIAVAILLLSKKFDSISILTPESYYSNLQQYIDFSNWYFYGDNIIYYALTIFVSSFFLFKKSYAKYISLVMSVLFFIVFSRRFYELITICSGYYWFVGLRFTTSIQLMIPFFIGCLIVYLLSKFNKECLIYIPSILICMFVLFYINNNMDIIKEQNWLASGMTQYGYSTNPIKKNDDMMPTVFVEVGQYFDEKDYGNYPILSEKEINWDGYPLNMDGLVYASNRLELCKGGGANNISSQDLQILYDFIDGKIPYEGIYGIIEDHNINYIILQKKEIVNELVGNNWTIELSNEKVNETYYLLKK